MTIDELAETYVTVTDISKPGNPRFRVAFFDQRFDCTNRDCAEMSAKPIRRYIAAAMQKAIEMRSIEVRAVTDKIAETANDLMTAPLSDNQFRLRAATKLTLICDRALDASKLLTV